MQMHLDLRRSENRKATRTSVIAISTLSQSHIRVLAPAFCVVPRCSTADGTLVFVLAGRIHLVLRVPCRRGGLRPCGSQPLRTLDQSLALRSFRAIGVSGHGSRQVVTAGSRTSLCWRRSETVRTAATPRGGRVCVRVAFSHHPQASAFFSC
ncbi:hypothetical protein PHLGIDRAFT_444938 [Phlebiopsis gigantea 11061_1 CR5-6]|uniref:Uncharacterized protein n=1 Tax=Phlebiopsis gigantea (strain 11061_1 CR5-6) TaxID=745531 RepID=A0A0C3RXZ5_PHLG1|nr:hypothetical protein PHLGIDRAFT_444938 [Phlebiopsis gigantea 11061_1 CR5-6]